MRVFVTGGTGLIGRHLVQALARRGDTPVVQSRDPEKARRALPPGAEVVGTPAVDGCDAVINLAGEPILGGRWSAAFKERLVSSRVETTKRLVAAIAAAARPPRVLVNASAIGYYGVHGDEALDESSAAGADFLAGLCLSWEGAALAATCRTVLLRTGLVLARDGGAMPRLLTAFRCGLGGPVAGGRQWVSWIHVDDVIGLILAAIDRDAVVGPLNATAPEPVTNATMARVIGRVLRRPAFLPAPGFAVRMALGEGAMLVTEGQKVLPRAALAAGYRFAFPDFEAAVRDVTDRVG